MGAHNFTDIATAKTATLAYESAVSEARYEYGNDPYSGTIATTNGFIQLPERLFKGLRVKTRVAILEALAFGDSFDAKSDKARAVFSELRRTWHGTEKWGRCYAVRLDSKTFAFSGWAAS